MTRGLLWQALAAAVGIAILIGLGVWQLERLAWKEA
jgi:cytochrome oxidase assembly protein ShyY1